MTEVASDPKENTNAATKGSGLSLNYDRLCWTIVWWGQREEKYKNIRGICTIWFNENLRVSSQKLFSASFHDYLIPLSSCKDWTTNRTSHTPDSSHCSNCFFVVKKIFSRTQTFPPTTKIFSCCHMTSLSTLLYATFRSMKLLIFTHNCLQQEYDLNNLLTSWYRTTPSLFTIQKTSTPALSELLSIRRFFHNPGGHIFHL